MGLRQLFWKIILHHQSKPFKKCSKPLGTFPKEIIQFALRFIYAFISELLIL